MERLFNTYKNHNIIINYCGLFLLLMVGVVYYSGATYLDELSLFICPLIASYFLLNKSKFSWNPALLFKGKFFKLVAEKWYLLGIAAVLIMIVHYVFIGSIPFISSLSAEDHLEIANVRKTGSGVPRWLVYLSGFAVKGILPFSILLAYKKNQRILFWLFAFVGAFYAVSLMQKSNIVIVFLPLVLHFILEKKWMKMIVGGVFILAMLWLLVWVANRAFDPEKSIETEKKAAHVGLYERIVLTPGKTVVEWFELIPAVHPHAKGCGYHFVAPFIGCKHVNYTLLLYEDLYPEYIERGVHGTRPSAAFMHEYANFGVIGLPISGLLHAILFFLLTGSFKRDWKNSIIFNGLPILLLGASAITTVFLTHAWIISLLIYYIYFVPKDD